MAKSKIKFLLKEPNATEKTIIFLVYRENFRFKYSIREQVLPAHWNKEKQRMREARGLPYTNFNRRLDKIERIFDDLVLRLKNEDRFNEKTLRNELDLELGFRQNETLADFIYNFVENSKQSGDYEKVKSLLTLRNKLIEFSAETGVGVNFNNINHDFFEKFKGWVSKQKKKDGGSYSLNYIDKMISNLSRMMAKSGKEGLHINTEYKSAPRDRERVYKVYLNLNELRQLITTSLPNYLSNAVDNLVLGCFTGLRVGNYLNIDPDVNINLKTGYIQAICNKNGPRLLIPIHPEIEKMIHRLGGLPRPISEQKFNKYIKEACRVAGINDKIVWFRTEGGRRVEHVNEKWELISSHTARRTFATNAIKAGMSIFDVMQITGHRSVKTFMLYICIDQEEAAERMKNHHFFSKAITVEQLPGVYWVKLNNKWIVAELHPGGVWKILGTEIILHKDSIDEIGEKIERK